MREAPEQLLPNCTKQLHNVLGSATDNGLGGQREEVSFFQHLVHVNRGHVEQGAAAGGSHCHCHCPCLNPAPFEAAPHRHFSAHLVQWGNRSISGASPHKAAGPPLPCTCSLFTTPSPVSSVNHRPRDSNFTLSPWSEEQCANHHFTNF